MPIDEGYIKFNCQWIQTPIDVPEGFETLNTKRQELFAKKQIGVYPEGIGYGNISMRTTEGFLISGTQTGHKTSLKIDDYSLVYKWDIEANTVWCRGMLKASSESMTHAVCYDLDPAIQMVIHIHDRDMWERLLWKVPTTAEDVPYGTPEMAYEVQRLYREGGFREERILAMAGHEEGLVILDVSAVQV